MIRVAVSGAGGKLANPIISAVAASEDLELAALYNPNREGVEMHGVTVTASPDDIEADVMVETAHPDVVFDNLGMWKEKGLATVVGTSGFTPERLIELREMWGKESPCLVVPNFSVGAVLMMRFAEMAAPHFAAAEVVEMHHDRKADAPSGTALATASRIGSVAPDQRRRVVSTETVRGARGGVVADVPVHSIRLPGLVAHQAVLLGNDGELLTIRHDTTDRASFMPGVLVAIRGVGAEPGVTVGIDHLV